MMLTRLTLAALLVASPVLAQVAPPAPPAQPAPRPAPAPRPTPPDAPRPAQAPRAPGLYDMMRLDIDVADLEWRARDAAFDVEWMAVDAERMAREMTDRIAPDVERMAREMTDRYAPDVERMARDMSDRYAPDPAMLADMAWRAEAFAPRAEWHAREAVEAMAAARVGRDASFRTAAPAAWAAQDPADSLYRLGRESLNRGDYRGAAALFQQIVRNHPRSAYAPDATYWEAFARYKLDTDQELRAALELLEKQVASRSGSYSADAAALAQRIRGTLAERGDQSMRAQVASRARAGDGCDREAAAVRVEALNALARIDSAGVMPVVRRTLDDTATCAAPLRSAAVVLLARQGTEGATSVLAATALRDPAAEVRSTAIAYLGRMRTDAAVGALEQVLRDAGDERTRAAALGALAYHASPRARTVLRTHAERDDVPMRLRSTALDALARDTSAANVQWLRALYGRADSAAVRERALSAVSRMPGAETTTWLHGIARDEGTPLRLRRSALAGYLRRQPPIAEVVRAYDAFPERDLRSTVLGELARRKEPEATDKLLAIARGDGEARMRTTAIELLTRKAKDDPRTRKLLLEIIGQ